MCFDQISTLAQMAVLKDLELSFSKRSPMPRMPFNNSMDTNLMDDELKSVKIASLVRLPANCTAEVTAEVMVEVMVEVMAVTVVVVGVVTAAVMVVVMGSEVDMDEGAMEEVVTVVVDMAVEVTEADMEVDMIRTAEDNTMDQFLLTILSIMHRLAGTSRQQFLSQM